MLVPCQERTNKVDASPWRKGLGGYLHTSKEQGMGRGQTSCQRGLTGGCTSQEVRVDQRSIPLLYRFGQINTYPYTTAVYIP